MTSSIPLDVAAFWSDGGRGSALPPLAAAVGEALACAKVHAGGQPEVEVRLGRTAPGGRSFVSGVSKAEWDAARGALFERRGAWRTSPSERTLVDLRFGDVRVTIEQPPEGSDAASKVVEVCAKETVQSWTLRTSSVALPDVRIAVATELKVPADEARAASAAAMDAIGSRARAAVDTTTALAVGCEVAIVEGGSGTATLVARLPPWDRDGADALGAALGKEPTLAALRATGMHWLVASAPAAVNLESSRVDFGRLAPRASGAPLRLTNVAGVAMIPVAVGAASAPGGAMAPPPPKRAKPNAAAAVERRPLPVPAGRYCVELAAASVVPVAATKLAAAREASRSGSAAAPLRRLREKRRTSFIDARAGWRVDVSRTRTAGNDGAGAVAPDALFRMLEVRASRLPILHFMRLLTMNAPPQTSAQAAPVIYEFEFEAAPLDASSSAISSAADARAAAVALTDRAMHALFPALLSAAGLPPLAPPPPGSAVAALLAGIAAAGAAAAAADAPSTTASTTATATATATAPRALGWCDAEWSTWRACPRFGAKTPIEGTPVVVHKLPLARAKFDASLVACEDSFDPTMAFEKYQRVEPRPLVIGLALDASALAAGDAFDASEMDDWDAQLVRVGTSAVRAAGVAAVGGGTVADIPPRLLPPSSAAVDAAVAALQAFVRSDASNAAIAVFSEDGCNRAGVVVVAWMMEHRSVELAVALDRFRRHRPPGVYAPHCLEFLVNRAKTKMKEKSARSQTVAPPPWDAFCGASSDGVAGRESKAPAAPPAAAPTLALALAVHVDRAPRPQPVCSLLLRSRGAGDALFAHLQALARAGLGKGSGGAIQLVVTQCVARNVLSYLSSPPPAHPCGRCIASCCASRRLFLCEPPRLAACLALRLPLARSLPRARSALPSARFYAPSAHTTTAPALQVHSGSAAADCEGGGPLACAGSAWCCKARARGAQV